MTCWDLPRGHGAYCVPEVPATHQGIRVTFSERSRDVLPQVSRLQLWVARGTSNWTPQKTRRPASARQTTSNSSEELGRVWSFDGSECVRNHGRGRAARRCQRWYVLIRSDDEPLFLQLWTSEERPYVAKLFFPGRWCWCWSNSSSTTRGGHSTIES